MWSRSGSDGRWVWTGTRDGVEVRFFGRGPQVADRGEELATLSPDGVDCAWTEQVHSPAALEVRAPGPAGEGDALVTREPGLALSVVTADCVPVMLAAGEWVAAVHAGWRGIVAGVVPTTVERLRAGGAGDPAVWTAWIGPAIGGCCYEVGPEVAERVAVASTLDAVLAWPGKAKPHLDLARAVATQLAAAGVSDVRPLVSCTQCDRDRL